MSILLSMTRSSPVRRLHRLRVNASLLLAVFLSAGTSLPSLDGLAYHQDSPEGGRAQSHIEAAGGCLNHADQCTLGRTATGAGADLTLAEDLRLELVASTQHRLLPAQPPASADRVGLPQSRAPPVQPA